MRTIEVYADITCPFAHVGLRRFEAFRAERGGGPLLRVRAWPLEHVNGRAFDGPKLAPEVAALQAGVAPDLFAGFDPARFPATSLPALAAEAAAYRLAPEVGERFSLEVRSALFERGLDIADPAVLDQLRDGVGGPGPTSEDEAQVLADHRDGQARGVIGSPHFFTDSGDFFCPSLDITHDDGELTVAFDVEGFRTFVTAAFSD